MRYWINNELKSFLCSLLPVANHTEVEEETFWQLYNQHIQEMKEQEEANEEK